MRAFFFALFAAVGLECLATDYWSQDEYRRRTYTNSVYGTADASPLVVKPQAGTNTAYADDWLSYSTAWVITNATTQDYVYFRGTNAALRSNGGAATITAITVGSSVTNNINLFLFAYPPSDTTNGQPWNMLLSGPGMTNLVAVVPMSTSYKVGTNSVLYSSGLTIPFSNMDTSKNLYYVATWASSTSVTNPAGASGDSTNFRVGFKMFRDK